MSTLEKILRNFFGKWSNSWSLKTYSILKLGKQTIHKYFFRVRFRIDSAFMFCYPIRSQSESRFKDMENSEWKQIRKIGRCKVFDANL